MSHSFKIKEIMQNKRSVPCNDMRNKNFLHEEFPFISSLILFYIKKIQISKI